MEAGKVSKSQPFLNLDQNLQLLLIYPCNLCQQVFDTAQELVSHKSSVHLDKLFQVTCYPLVCSSPLVCWPPAALNQYYSNGRIHTDMNSGRADLPLIKENELGSLDSSGSRISCRYCGELFSNCDRDELFQVSCKRCADTFGNTSVSSSNNNSGNDSSAKVVLKSYGNVGLNSLSSTSSVTANTFRPSILSRGALKTVKIAPDKYEKSGISPQSINSSKRKPRVATRACELNNLSTAIIPAAAKNIGNGTGGSFSSEMTVIGNVNERGNGSSVPVAKTFACRFSDKKFPRSTIPKTHERTHTGKKPYSCKVCSKSCTQSSSRNRHEKFTHSLERPTKVSRAQQGTALFGQPTGIPNTLNVAAGTGKSIKLVQFLNTNNSEANSESTQNRRPRDEGDDDPKLHPEEPLSSRPRRASETSMTNMNPPVLTPEVNPSPVISQQNLQRHIKSSCKGRTGTKNLSVDYALKMFNFKLSEAVNTVKTAPNAAMEDEKNQHRKNGIFTQSINSKSLPPVVSQVAKLVRHATEQHAEDKPFVCPKCPVRFDNGNLLRTHFGGHDGGKPLLCLECGEWFRYDIGFKQHFKSYHTLKVV